MLRSPNLLSPWYVTGFSDGDSCFTVSLSKDSQRKLGWRVSASFAIGLDAKDKVLLNQLQAYFGVGKVYKGEKIYIATW